MPTVERDGTELYYEAAGSGETVAFVPDVGCGAWLWGWQHAALAGPYEVVTWNTRGTGESDAATGPLSMRTFANDFDAVLGAHGASSAHVVGCGLGAMVALEYARARGRARKLVLVSGASAGDAYAPEGLFAPLGDRAACLDSLANVLSPEFCESQPDVLESIADWRASEDADRAGFDRQAAALDDWNGEPLFEIDNETLVVDGERDPLRDDDAGRALADGLPRADRLGFTDASHFVHVERSRPVNDAILAFLASED